VTADEVDFAHESERQLALLLDFYEVAWEYEPRSFAIEWDADGHPTRMFTPDFWLPDEGTFVEVTTMDQRLVTKKNGKVKALRRLHPHVRCRILYQRDYLHLVLKYGLEAPERLADVLPTRMSGRPTLSLPDEDAVPA
jgi:hypothetical protein